MTYVISDLYGYPLEKLKKLLRKAEFSNGDFLYILGNHEAMLLSCEFVTKIQIIKTSYCFAVALFFAIIKIKIYDAQFLNHRI